MLMGRARVVFCVDWKMERFEMKSKRTMLAATTAALLTAATVTAASAQTQTKERVGASAGQNLSTGGQVFAQGPGANAGAQFQGGVKRSEGKNVGGQFQGTNRSAMTSNRYSGTSSNRYSGIYGRDRDRNQFAYGRDRDQFAATASPMAVGTTVGVVQPSAYQSATAAGDGPVTMTMVTTMAIRDFTPTHPAISASHSAAAAAAALRAGRADAIG
jgi:hypothetical protein